MITNRLKRWRLTTVLYFLLIWILVVWNKLIYLFIYLLIFHRYRRCCIEKDISPISLSLVQVRVVQVPTEGDGRNTDQLATRYSPNIKKVIFLFCVSLFACLFVRLLAGELLKDLRSQFRVIFRKRTGRFRRRSGWWYLEYFQITAAVTQRWHLANTNNNFVL